MASIITNQFRLSNLKALQAAIADTVNNSFYLCLGKALPWADEANPDVPKDTNDQIRAFWDYALAGKKVLSTNTRQGIFLRPWVSGQFYDMFRNDIDGTVATKNLDGTARSSNPASLFDCNYFVINPANLNVYICLYNRSHTTNLQVASTDNSFLTDTSANVIHGSDGYDWKYMFTVPSGDAALFNTPSFIPASTTGSAALVAGGIYNVLVTTAGAYTVAPTATVVGDGTGAAVTAHIAGGGVVWCEVTNPGSGYTHAKINFTGGTGAGGTVAVPVIGTRGGIGSAPADELGGIYLIIQQKFIADESGSGSKFTVANDFRQIGLLKNPTLTSTLVTSDAIRLCRSLVLTTDPGSFTADDTLTGGTSGAKGKVVDYIAASKTIRYNLDVSIATSVLGKDFAVGDVVTDAHAHSGTVATSGVHGPEVDLNTGALVYFENRKAITRSSSQTEDVRIIVEF